MKKLSIILIVVAIVCVLASVVLGMIGVIAKEIYVVYSLSIGGIGVWVFYLASSLFGDNKVT